MAGIMDRTWASVARIAAAQHGLVGGAQVLSAGATPSMLKRWVAQGRFERLHQGVFRLAGVPVTWEQGLLAAVIAAGSGALASHRSAARLWQLADDDAVDVSVPLGRAPRPSGARVHRATDLEDATVVVRNRIPSTTPMRTLVDLGSVCGPSSVEAALNAALTRRLLTIEAVEVELERVAARGRRGAGVLRTVLDRRALGSARADSELEARMARLFRRFSLPPATFQHVVRESGRFIARVDFAYPLLRLAIEVDGWEAHSSPGALQHDLDRQNALMAAGWTVLRFTWEDVVLRPAKVAARIASMLPAPVLL